MTIDVVEIATPRGASIEATVHLFEEEPDAAKGAENAAVAARAVALWARRFAGV